MNISFMLFTLLMAIITVMVMFLIPKLSKGHENQSDDARLQVRQLYFAGVCLAIMAIIFVESMAFYYFGHIDGRETPGKEIFENSTKIISPLVTLVLGYYFGRNQK